MRRFTVYLSCLLAVGGVFTAQGSRLEAGSGQTTHARLRPPPPPAKEYAGAHILIAYVGARRARPKVTRTQAMALALTKRLATRLQKNPALFAKLAKTYSDGPTSAKGGYLGAWLKGRMVPAFDNAIAQLHIGQVSGPVHTPFGYHVIKRLPLPPTYSGRHILIAYKGAMRAASSVVRTKSAALKLAKKLSAQLKRAPGKFIAFANRYSDGPSAPRGGFLGTWKKGRMVPAFEKAVEKLRIGQVSGAVETPFGYHIIKREKP